MFGDSNLNEESSHSITVESKRAHCNAAAPAGPPQFPVKRNSISAEPARRRSAIEPKPPAQMELNDKSSILTQSAR